MVQVAAMIKAGDAAEGLELLDRSAGAAGEDARLFEPQIAEVRARALAASGRWEGAQRALRTGLLSARNYGLPYEEAMLLLARIDIAQLAGLEPASQDVVACHDLLDGLGVDSTPRPVR